MPDVVKRLHGLGATPVGERAGGNRGFPAAGDRALAQGHRDAGIKLE